MKIIFYAELASLVFLAGCAPIIYTTNQPVYTDPAPQVYVDQPQTNQVFYDELSPYGQWIDYPDYGYVWQPNVDADFRPYETNGNWVYSDYGWTWVSNYSWGWAPFHYGRWFYDGYYGWLWEPGNEWAPAWVTWGHSGDYYGWAPIPPGADINSGYRPRNNDWNFVDARNINTPNVHNYVVRNNVTVINNTTIITNINSNTNNRPILYNRGPRPTEVENFTHTRIQPVTITGAARPGQSLNNGQLNVYRPAIKQNTNQGNTAPAPQRVISYRQGQGGNSNPANPGKRPGIGQGNGSNPNPQQNQQNPRQGSVINQNQPQVQPDGRQGNNPQQNQQNPRQGNGQNNLPTPNMQLLKQREMMNQTPNQPAQQPVRPVQAPNPPVQQQARPVQQQNPPMQQQPRPAQMPNQPAQQQPRPVQAPNPPAQQQARPVQAPNLPAQQRPRPVQPPKTNQKPPEKKVLPPPVN